jgi:hypothetical protein
MGRGLRESDWVEEGGQEALAWMTEPTMTGGNTIE